ncbi:MAG: hypothetical protein JWN70_153 [Planctomycetaceae bacterium]|nr:hypothetical protein [Planctomycetaceae bacterium]
MNVFARSSQSFTRCSAENAIQAFHLTQTTHIVFCVARFGIKAGSNFLPRSDYRIYLLEKSPDATQFATHSKDFPLQISPSCLKYLGDISL